MFHSLLCFFLLRSHSLSLRVNVSPSDLNVCALSKNVAFKVGFNLAHQLLRWEYKPMIYIYIVLSLVWYVFIFFFSIQFSTPIRHSIVWALTVTQLYGCIHIEIAFSYNNNISFSICWCNNIMVSITFSRLNNNDQQLNGAIWNGRHSIWFCDRWTSNSFPVCTM